jgi:Domain of unknown function (DUF2382)
MRALRYTDHREKIDAHREKIDARHERTVAGPESLNREKQERGVIMHGQCLVAVYPSRSEAEQALRAARGSGIPSSNIRMSGDDMERPHGWDFLFSQHVPEKEKTYYRIHLAGGRTALSVLIDGGAPPARIDAVEEILDRYHPVEVRVEEEEEGPPAAARGKLGKKAGAPSPQAAPKAAAKGQEEIIPLPREEAKVGAKVTDRVHHIKTYVVEEPFEKEVSLHDEHLVVERRAATAGKDGGEISEREYEFHERHEEPVVVMETRAGEELVVRTEHTQRTERVRGKARRTEAKVEKESSAPAPARSPAFASHAPASMKGRS